MNSTPPTLPATTVFGIGDLVDIQNRDLGCYGSIKELRGDKVLVHFREPRMPNTGRFMGRLKCNGCGNVSTLEQESSASEVVCRRPHGCGHQHGFEERDEEVAISLLILISKAVPTQEAAAAPA